MSGIDNLCRRNPLVSVIIPTRQRADRVTTAVLSALHQSVQDIEVIVVVDGPCEETLEALEVIGDDRLVVMTLPKRSGSGAARNAGARAAGGRWIAFLDDDDLWMPEKLAWQLEAARSSRYRQPVISCRLLARNETQSFVWPRLLPKWGQPVSEYIFCRKKPATGDGIVQTSTMLAPAELVRQVPFDPHLKRYVDVDWLLRAAEIPGVGVEFVLTAQPLVIWHIEANRVRVTNQSGWRWDVEWIRNRRHLVTRRAYGAFLLTFASVRAARERAWAAFPLLLAKAFRSGDPGLAELIYHVGNFALPKKVCGRLASQAKTPVPAGTRLAESGPAWNASMVVAFRRSLPGHRGPAGWPASTRLN